MEWKRSTRTGKPFTLALIDVDRFKSVNDVQGHLSGDLVLKRLGQIFERGCRSTDVVARYGGDEFVILMPGTDAEQGLRLAHRLRPSVLGDRLLQEKGTTASFGLATFPLNGSTPQGTDSNCGRVHVPLEASGRQRDFHGEPVRRYRGQTMEARRPRSISGRHPEATFLDGARGLSGYPSTARTTVAIPGDNGNFLERFRGANARNDGSAPTALRRGDRNNHRAGAGSGRKGSTFTQGHSPGRSPIMPRCWPRSWGWRKKRWKRCASERCCTTSARWGYRPRS